MTFHRYLQHSTWLLGEIEVVFSPVVRLKSDEQTGDEQTLQTSMFLAIDGGEDAESGPDAHPDSKQEWSQQEG